MRVRVRLIGCDDTTYIAMDVSEDEKALLDRLAAASEAESNCPCMPVMAVAVDNEGQETAHG
jgi:hypothetical protein